MRRRPVLALAAVVLASAVPATASDPLPHRTDLDLRDRARVAAVTAPATRFQEEEPFEALPGGAGTTRARPGRESFSQPFATLDPEGDERFRLGRAMFRKLWVSAPSSTQASDGLGPLYNARACETCHQGDGRGSTDAGGAHGTVVLRLSVSGPDGRPMPDPVYGSQLQPAAVPGHAGEGRRSTTWTPVPVTLADGTVVELRKPSHSIADPGYGAFAEGLGTSARLPMPIFGLGLLEAIHPGDIVALADPDDEDGDGISGRPASVVDPATGRLELGRFGWKAAEPDIPAQVASAFSADMGLSTPLFPAAFGECTPAQEACRAAPDGVQPRHGPHEVPAEVLDLVVAYTRTIAVPMRRGFKDRQVLAGKQVFMEAGCGACHQPKFVTRRDAADPSLAFQLIWPYTDLLLHDMGDDLADGRPEGVRRDGSGGRPRSGA